MERESSRLKLIMIDVLTLSWILEIQNWALFWLGSRVHIMLIPMIFEKFARSIKRNWNVRLLLETRFLHRRHGGIWMNICMWPRTDQVFSQETFTNTTSHQANQLKCSPKLDFILQKYSLFHFQTITQCLQHVQMTWLVKLWTLQPLKSTWSLIKKQLCDALSFTLCMMRRN